MKIEIFFEDGRHETFDSVERFKVTWPKRSATVIQPLIEGNMFKVDPLGLNREKFTKNRTDRRQEETRKKIMEALCKLDRYPERYGISFYTVIPEKKWNGKKSIASMELYAKSLGGCMSDSVEQSLEWAQRICNGESWEKICNDADTAEWFRVIKSNDRIYKRIGGSKVGGERKPASYSENRNYFRHSEVANAVPLVTFRKK